MIKIVHAKKQFGDQIIFDDLNLEIETNGIHVIQGVSGSGKTTLLNILAGIDCFNEGELVVEETPAIIFQNYEMIQELTVRENMNVAIDLFKDLCFSNREMICETLSLNELMDQYPNELSGGQKQRVGIARALFQNPRLILCDEPTESLDIDNKNKVMQLFKKLSEKCCIVMVTHDQQIVDEYADNVYLIENHQINKIQERASSNIQKRDVMLQVNNKAVYHLIHKICLKRNIIFSVLVGVLTAILFTLSDFEAVHFNGKKDINAVIKDQVFFQTISDEFDPEYEEVLPVLEFTKAVIHDKEYRYSILSTSKQKINQYLHDGKVFEGMEIVINDAMAKRIDSDCLDQEIKLYYNLGNDKKTIKTKIVGIVHEDIETPILYFDYDASIEYLERKNELEKFKSESIFYNKEISMDEAEEYFKEKKISYIQPYYEHITNIIKEGKIYSIIFKTVIVMILSAIIIFILVYLNQDVQWFLRINAILSTLGIPLKLLNFFYIVNKTLYFTVFFGLFIGIQKYFSTYIGNTIFEHRLNLFIITILIYCIFIIGLCFNMRKMKKKNISNLLKIEN